MYEYGVKMWQVYQQLISLEQHAKFTAPFGHTPLFQRGQCWLTQKRRLANLLSECLNSLGTPSLQAQFT